MRLQSGWRRGLLPRWSLIVQGCPAQRVSLERSHSGMNAPPALVVRKLDDADLGQFHLLRLQALRLHPEAFGASFEEERTEGSARMIGAYPSVMFGAFAEGGIVGCAGLLVPVRVKQRHHGNLFSVFVAPGWRGRGLSRELLDQVVAHARMAELRHITLSVTIGNMAARALYRSAGFVSFGVEPDALLIDGILYDEERMVLRLT
jgi:ribosomal protein S18 acetylase RimI-like enzyme